MRHRKEAREKILPRKDSEDGVPLMPEESCISDEVPLIKAVSGTAFPFCIVASPCHLLFRIFVNRSLALEKIKCFGFDMDYTLASK